MNKKHFTIDLVVSEYHPNDEGFYTVKRSMEVSQGKRNLIESFEKIILDVKDYIIEKMVE